MSSPGPRVRIPLRLVIIDVLGAVLAAIGFYGFIEPAAAGVLPFLGVPGLPTVLLSTGIAMMGYAIIALMRRLAAAARANRI